jgi:polyphosphate glucokinase
MGSGSNGLALGVDVGGTAIKAGVFDLATRSMCERIQVATPLPATPAAVGDVVGDLCGRFGFCGPVGFGFPAVIVDGVVKTAANVDTSWHGVQLSDVFGELLPGPPIYLNDADAAGLAETRYGAGRGHQGLVMIVTFGTGLGVSLFHQGQLIPNCELGHIEIDGVDAETRASATARSRDQLSWEQWGLRASGYLRTLEALLWPEVIVLGGGVSADPAKWVGHLRTRTPLKVAQLAANAGIVGAALAAAEAVT